VSVKNETVSKTLTSSDINDLILAFMDEESVYISQMNKLIRNGVCFRFSSGIFFSRKKNFKDLFLF